LGNYTAARRQIAIIAAQSLAESWFRPLASLVTINAATVIPARCGVKMTPFSSLAGLLNDEI